MNAPSEEKQLGYNDLVKIVATIHEKPSNLKPNTEVIIEVKKAVADALKDIVKDDDSKNYDSKKLIDGIIDCYITFVKHVMEAAEKGGKNSSIDCKDKVSDEKTAQILSDIFNKAIKELKDKSDKSKYYYKYILDSLKKAYSKVLREKKHEKNVKDRVRNVGWLFDTCYDEARGERLQCALQQIQKRLDNDPSRACLAFLLLLASYVEMIRNPDNVAYAEWYPYLLRGAALAEGACKYDSRETRPLLPVCPARGDAAAIAYYILLLLTLNCSGPNIRVEEETVKSMLWSLLHKKK